MIEQEFNVPNNQTKNMTCPDCNGVYVSTYDYEWHKKHAKCGIRALEKLGWCKSRKNNNIDLIDSIKVPQIIKAINEGHSTFGNYTYWIFNNFVCRKKVGDSSY